MKLWVLHTRQGYIRLFSTFADARAAQDKDNRISLEEIMESGDLEFGGSEESGHFYIEDGGDITLTEVEE